MSIRTPVYLDHNATTPMDPRVLDLQQEVARTHFGNPASAHHAFGWAAARLVEEARAEVAGLVGVTPREIIFTSGATEAAALAVLGAAELWRPEDAGGVGSSGEPGHLVISAFEHDAVEAPVQRLEARGWRVTRVAPGAGGVVEPGAVADAIEPATLLVAVMAAQNEIGTLQPIGDIGAICRERRVLFLCDAAQAAGKVPLDATTQDIHLLALSAHKLHGPKGVGALYVRRRDPRVVLAPLVSGGGQERGLRGGTLNVPGIVAFGEACRLAGLEMDGDAVHLRGLAERFLAVLRRELTDWVLNGDPVRRLPGQLNLSFAGVRAHRLLGALPVLAVSSSSACSSAESRPSRVLAALGVPDALASASLRLAPGRFTTAKEMDFAAHAVVAAVRRLRTEEPDRR
ncbi:MAG: cysteine desulfurase family protein [Candidatus Krumholzibacteriia bacterium]